MGPGWVLNICRRIDLVIVAEHIDVVGWFATRVPLKWKIAAGLGFFVSF